MPPTIFCDTALSTVFNASLTVSVAVLFTTTVVEKALGTTPATNARRAVKAARVVRKDMLSVLKCILVRTVSMVVVRLCRISFEKEKVIGKRKLYEELWGLAVMS
jgi:hypothetical protein